MSQNALIIPPNGRTGNDIIFKTLAPSHEQIQPKQSAIRMPDKRTVIGVNAELFIQHGGKLISDKGMKVICSAKSCLLAFWGRVALGRWRVVVRTVWYVKGSPCGVADAHNHERFGVFSFGLS